MKVKLVSLKPITKMKPRKKSGIYIDDLIKINYAAQKITSMNEKEWQKFSSYAEEIQANTKSSYFESALKMF